MHYEAGDIVPFVVIFQDYDGSGATPSDYASSNIKLARYKVSDGTVTEITTGITITTLAGWLGCYFCKYTVPASGNYAFIVRGETTDTDIASQEVFTSFESGRAWVEGLGDLDTSDFTVVSTVSGSELSPYRATTFNQEITGLGDISGYDKLVFCVKNYTSDLDSVSLIFIDEDDGLLYINGAAATDLEAKGTITIDDEDAGDITVFLHESEMAKLSAIDGIHYGVKGILDTDTDALVEGTFNILGITPRAIT